MKKHIRQWAMAILLCMAGSAWADSFTIEQFTIAANEEKQVSLYLDGTRNYIAFQLDMYLPAGVSIATNSRGKLIASVNMDMQEEAGDHSVTTNKLSDVEGHYRFIVDSSENYAFSKKAGNVLDITLKASDMVTTGAQEIRLTEQVLNDEDRNEITFEDTALPFTTALRTTIRPLGYATFSWPRRVDFRGAEGLTAWIVTEVGDGSVKMEQVEKVEEGTAVVLQGAEGTYELSTFPDDGICDDTEGNKLTGTANAPYTVEGDGVFVLSNKTDGIAGFYPAVTGLEIAQYKAYLNKSDVSLGVRFFAFDGTASGISTANAEVADDSCYDLMGRRVGSQRSLRKGLYIRNRKVITVK